MTRKELLYWITEGHSCEILQLPEGKARCIMFRNPKTGTRATLDTPIDDRRVRDPTVAAICMQLGIPLPDCPKEAEEIVKGIRNDYGHLDRK